MPSQPPLTKTERPASVCITAAAWRQIGPGPLPVVCSVVSRCESTLYSRMSLKIVLRFELSQPPWMKIERSTDQCACIARFFSDAFSCRTTFSFVQCSDGSSVSRNASV